MARFNMDAVYDGTMKLSIAALCQELMEEYAVRYPQDVPPGEEYFREKIKSSDRSGLINKLYDKLGFDIEAMMDRSNQDRFDGLKILKMLYYIEKDGNPKKNKMAKAADKRICITDILAKPRLENVNTEYSIKSEFGDIIDAMLLMVEQNIPDVGKRIRTMSRLNTKWEDAVDWIFEYVLSDDALRAPELNMVQLERIQNYIENRIIKKCKGLNPRVFISSEGIMESFHTLLLCHRCLCNERDRININYQINIRESPDYEFVSEFRKTENIQINWQVLELIERQLKGGFSSREADFVIHLVNYLKPIEEEDKKDILFAVKYAKTVASWIEQDKNVNFEKGIALDMLVIILQEIIAVKREKQFFKNDYWGNRYTKKPLLSVVKKPEQADAVARLAWMKKLENRTAVNFGNHDLIVKKRQIENSIYEIKSLIYSFYSLDDLVLVNEFISHFIARSIISDESVLAVRINFERYIMERLWIRGRAVRFVFPPQAVNCNDMFREFLMDYSGISDFVAEDVVRQINEILDDECIIEKGIKITFEAKYTPMDSEDYIFTFIVNRRQRVVIYQNFVRLSSDDKIIRIRELGLDQFAKKDIKMFF